MPTNKVPLTNMVGATVDVVHGKVVVNTAEETLRKQQQVSPLVPTVLARARDLLSDRTKWTTGATAKGPDGQAIAVDDPWAVKWCAVGAIEKCAKEAWAEDLCSQSWPDGWSLLVHLSSQEATPHIIGAAKALRPGHHYLHNNTSIPNVNDSPTRGGYQAVINGLRLATGQSVDDLTAAFAKRAKAAMKGWETRRKREAEEARVAHEAWLLWLKEREAKKALATQEMSFGGTIVSPQINADAKKEVTV